LKKTLEGRRVELKSRVELANQNDGRWHYTGNDIVGNLSQIESQIRLAEHETALTQRKLEALQTHKSRLAVRAPFDGTVLELPHIDNGAVRRGDVIAVLEQRRLRQVTAFLTQDEVLRVGRGDEVVLYVPALKESLKGRVIQIDRTSGFIQEQLKAQPPNYRWRSNVDRSAKVIIAFADPARVQDVERYRSGMPVVVVFPRNSPSAITSTIAEPLRSRS
jgi:multidrug resistance efflux pump